MLTRTGSFFSTPFILHVEYGYVSSAPALTYCLAHFDQAHYHDVLFSQIPLPFPASMHSAAIKRKAEYLAGRYCAHLLLQKAGCTGTVQTDSDRAPVWPEGWSGSLSHSGKQAIAIIAPKCVGLLPGVDIEHLQSDVLLETADMFTCSMEQEYLASISLPYDRALLVAFSAKESLFKSLYPRVRYMFGFGSAMLTSVDTTQRRFALQLTQNLTPEFQQYAEFTGYYQFIDDMIITCIA